MSQTRTAQTIIQQALRSVGAIATGETPSSNELSEGLAALQDLIASLSTESLMIPYVNERQSLSLTAGTAHYTIGSGGDFDTTRPIEVLGGTLSISTSTETPIRVIDIARYRRIALKGTQAPPYFVYYNPTTTLGELYFYPTPNAAYTVYLDSLDPITEPAALATNVTIPEGYNRALRFLLAEDLALEYGVPDSKYGKLQNQARKAKKVLVAHNAAMQLKTATIEIDRVAGETFSIDAC